MVGLKKLIFMVFALCIANIIFSQEILKSYYVSAQGNDEINNGRTEATAFKTLRKAIEVASKGIIKRITIIGTLNQASENNSTMSSYAVFFIDYNGKDELLITGKENASTKEKAVLSAAGTKVRVVNLNLSIENKSKVRFEHIEISGANTNHDGAGIYAFSGYTTLGKGTVIKNNTTSGDGGGVYVGEHCIIEDGVVIAQNSAAYGGGIYDKSSELTINGGLITKNNAQFFGGGISSGNSSSSLFTVNNCTISENMAGENGGGLYACGESIINNVVIVNNSAKANGGGIYRKEINGNYGKEYKGLTINNCDIRENTAEFGAGMYLFSGKCTLSTGNIKKNKATFVGGGVYVDSAVEFINSEAVITENQAGDGGENIFERE